MGLFWYSAGTEFVEGTEPRTHNNQLHHDVFFRTVLDRLRPSCCGCTFSWGKYIVNEFVTSAPTLFAPGETEGSEEEYRPASVTSLLAQVGSLTAISPQGHWLKGQTFTYLYPSLQRCRIQLRNPRRRDIWKGSGMLCRLTFSIKKKTHRCAYVIW